jgi:hypothetical protein
MRRFKMKNTNIIMKNWIKHLFFLNWFIKNERLTPLLLLFVSLFIFLLPITSFGATVYAKNISGTVYYQIGATSCADITMADKAGDLEGAIAAAGSGGTCYICEGTYEGTDLDSDGCVLVNNNNMTIKGVGTVLLKSGGTGTNSYAVDFFGNADNSTMTGINVEVQNLSVNNYGIIIDSGAEYVTVTNCDVTCVDVGADNDNWYGIHINGNHATVSYCDVSGTEFGIDIGEDATAAIVSHNVIHDMKAGSINTDESDCITVTASDHIVHDHTGTFIEYNTCYGYRDDGIDMFWGSNVTTRYNEVYGGTDWTYGAGGSGNGIKMGSSGTVYPVSHGNKAIGNYIHDTFWYHGITSNNAHDFVIAYNVLKNIATIDMVNVYEAGIFLAGSPDKTIDHPQVYNNTIIMGTGHGSAIFTNCLSSDTGTPVIQNNILSKGASSTNLGEYTAYDFDATGDTITGGGNILVNDSAINKATSYTNTGNKDKYAKNALFNSGKLTLSSSSPAIDAGINLGSTYKYALSADSTWPSGILSVDQDEYGAGWEIGAYAYQPVVKETIPSAPNLKPIQ